jgi:hypothetical protein
LKSIFENDDLGKVVPTHREHDARTNLNYIQPAVSVQIISKEVVVEEQKRGVAEFSSYKRPLWTPEFSNSTD